MTERLTVEHYVGKCFVKCAHIILGSRVYQDEDRKPSLDKRSAQWFLLEVDELAGLSARLDPWRRDVYAPLVIEIYIQPWDTNLVMPAASTPGRPDSHCAPTANAGGKTLLERWTLSYTSGSSAAAGGVSNSRPVMEPAAVYKRLILLIRSLYSYVRVLPAYRMYRACKRHGRELFNTSYSISTTPLPLPHQQHYGSTAAAAVQHAGCGSSSSRMQQFCFSPIETMYGVFEMSVEYQPATTVHFLEQTTLLPCQPRIITDYVDGPYARSAPNHRVMRQQSGSSSSSSGATRDTGDTDGTLGFLRSSQHQAPLVRHSWSSKDIPVVQRGFNPPARSNSLNSAAAAAAGSSGGQQQQQQQVLLHRRSLSQGYGGSAVDSPRGSSLGHGGPVTTVSPPVITHVGSYGSNNSPGMFIGPSSLGRPPLPHSPAGGAAAAANVHHHGSSNAGAGGALPPASPGTPSSSSTRTGGVGSTILRSLSANAAAAASAAAAAAAAAAAGIASSAPGQAGTGLSSLAVQQLSRLGSSFSSSSSPLGSAPRVLGFGAPRQQQQQQKPLMDPQARQQGFYVRESSDGGGSSSRGVQDDTAGYNAPVAAVTAAADPYHHQQSQQQPGAAQSEDFIQDSRKESAAATAESTDGSNLPTCRVSSAPVTIPGRGKGRARSVTDLPLMAAAAAAADGDDAAEQQQQQGLRQQQSAARSRTQGGLSAAVALGLQQQQQQQGSDSSSMLPVAGIQQHKQQFVAASSAPAAPRGMLGQLLSGSNTTSPSVSPPYTAAAAAAAVAAVAANRPSAAATGEDQTGTAADEANNSSSSATDQQDAQQAAAASGRSHAIIIRPQQSQIAYHAAAAASPSPSSRLLQLSHSRTPSAGYTVGFSHGAQPPTPGGPTSILSCSPQLPFAFTPSGASLGMSIISLTDQHKYLQAGSAGAAAAAARGPAAAVVPGGLIRTRSATGGSAPAAAAAAAAAGSSEVGSSGAGLSNIGTPSPPPHVSCVRDITGLATIRRPSWSSRSSSFDVAASASLPRHLSISPMGDLLDPALLGCSGSNSSGHNAMRSLGMGRGAVGSAAAARPAAAAAAVVGSGVVMTPAVVVPGGFGSNDQDESSTAGCAAATAPIGGGNTPVAIDGRAVSAAGNTEGLGSAASETAAGAGTEAAGSSAAAAAGTSAGDDMLLGSANPDGTDSDILPFAIDTEIYLSSATHAAGAAGAAGHQMHAQQQFQQKQQQPIGPRFEMQGCGATGAPMATIAAAERDVAVGAFVKLVQEASSRQLQRCHPQQQQQQGLAGSGALQGRGSQQGSDVHIMSRQQQQLSVADALDQVQHVAAQLEMVVYPQGTYTL